MARMLAMFATLLLAVGMPVLAQESWPSRPVRVVVPSSPGGGTDAFARVLSLGLTESLKQPFVVENRPGGSGNIGAETVAKAAPDGYTMLVTANASIAIGPALHRKLGFDVFRDFIPVSRGVTTPLVLVAHPSLPAKSAGELVALGTRDPNRITYGSAGTATPTHLGLRRFEEVSGAKFVHVPYKGVGAGYKDLLSGEIKFMFPDLATAYPHIRAGKVNALVITERHRLVPTVPTFAEAGFPGVEFEGYFGVLMPAGTSPAIVERLSGEIAKAMRAPAVAERLDALALIPIFDTPADFAVRLRREQAFWAGLVKRNGIVAED